VEIQVQSINCPTKIRVGTDSGIKELDFEEYLNGVLPYEMHRSYPTEALKAQAVAARNFAVSNMGRHAAEGYDLCDKTHCQVWMPPEDDGDGYETVYPPTTNQAVTDTEGTGATFDGTLINTTYFSSTHNHYTKNSEDKWNYSSYLRKTLSPESSGNGGHGIGMAQVGAKSLAESGTGYEDILKHYYGPVPPYLKKISVTQDGTTKYEAYWTDNNDYPNPTRKLTVSKNERLKTDADATIEMQFNERVLTGSDAASTVIKVGSEEATYVTGTLREGNNPPEKLSKKLTKEQLANIGNGKHKIKIDAKHEFAQEWQLDNNPTTFAYQNHNASSIVNYEAGIDENHEITLGILPIITSTSPENNSYNLATDSKITITFDSEMDAESVGSAIAVQPVITASYVWSADKKTLTMTPAPGLMANTDYTVTVYDTAKSAAEEQLDGDKDGKAGGSYSFSFSTKKANLTVTELASDYIDGSTYWVKAGAKTVKVQILDENGKAFGTGGTSYNIPQLQVKFANGKSQTISLSPASSLDGWSGTISVASGADGKAVFSSPNTPVTGITSFMVDTTKPKIESAGPAKSTTCNCPYGPLAFQFDVIEAGSGIASTAPIGLGLSAGGCYAPGSYQYGAIVEDRVGNTTSMTGSISVIQNKCINPDDNYSVTIMNIPGATLPSVNIAGKKVAVLGNGYAYSAQRFLSDKVVIESTIIDPDFSPEIYTEYPLLIIPTGGLSGLVQSEMFKAKLAKYVENGGVILAFSQNQGYEFEALPGGKVTGYGYTNDQQCFTNAAYIDGWHQIFSGQGKANLDLNIDGFMTGIPEEGQTFLKRVANGQSALAVYPYGNGYVIATTLYTDWGYSVSQYTTQEINLVRDIVAWAKMPMELPEIKPGETVSLSVPVMNNTSTDAVNVKIVVRDPAKNLIAEFSNPMTLAAGEYALVAKLKDVNGNVSQEFINYFNIRHYPIVKNGTDTNYTPVG
jgi:hypothetical protein